ncbi:MAG: glutathione S-transferase [Alteromonadaceae bacterium]|nr:MAG: glutathione S-transferase [Alteromonadaceae bacterium]
MTDLVLTYFDFDGGRGEPARLAMHIGNIEFTDKRFPMAEFEEVRKGTPLGQVPTLLVDERQVTQGNAINRYVGKLAGLYPEDAYQALLCDEVMEGIDDLLNSLVRTFGLEGEALKEAREAFVAGPVVRYLAWLEKNLAQSGGEFFADGRLTLADLKVFVLVSSLGGGQLEHIPVDVVDTIAPALSEHHQRIGQTAAITDYYAGR